MKIRLLCNKPNYPVTADKVCGEEAVTVFRLKDRFYDPRCSKHLNREGFTNRWVEISLEEAIVAQVMQQ